MLLPIAWAAVSCSWLAHLDHALAGDSALFIYLSNYLFVYLFIFFVRLSHRFIWLFQCAAPHLLEHLESRAGDGEFAAVFT